MYDKSGVLYYIAAACLPPWWQVWSLLQEEEIYYPAFRKSQLYVKLLIELDLLKEQKTEYGSADEGR